MRPQIKKIPKIIHQTWKTGKIPDEWRDPVASWKQFHPDWEYHLWTDEDNRIFVQQAYPEFLDLYDAYTYNIQRADAIRYLILHTYGGLYADCDVECLRPFDDLVSGNSFVIGLEPEWHWHQPGERSPISNAVMAAVPGHSFLRAVILSMKKINPRIVLHGEVLATTGPVMINNVFKQYVSGDMTVLDSHIFSPLHGSSREMHALRNQTGDVQNIKARIVKNGTYAVHYWDNTWTRNIAGDLVNPDPYSVQGYSFYPGMDSVGHDIGNVGRNIEKLAVACNKRYDAVGFNTDGFLKNHIRPRHTWERWSSHKSNEGLYVKKAWEYFLKSKHSSYQDES